MMDWLSQIIGFTGRAFDLNFDDRVYSAQAAAKTVLLPVSDCFFPFEPEAPLAALDPVDCHHRRKSKFCGNCT